MTERSDADRARERLSRNLGARSGSSLGRYELVRRIGSGGMAEVYEAVHRGLKKTVALKVLLPEVASNDDLRARFLREGEAAIAYDPDGCQGWIIDDGAEGYSGRRYDPASGLPVCNNLYPPGTVVGNYQTDSAPVKDYVPGRRN